MATTSEMSCVDQIGEAAGAVWHYLDQNGSTSLTKLAKELDVPRDVLMQGLGWLAREDKIWIDEQGRTKTVGLR
jgi:xanthine dehydrogenase molybdopterin-binding subunit B